MAKKKGKKRGRSTKQLRYLFASGILSKRGKGKKAKVVYKKGGGKKKMTFKEKMAAKRAKMSPTEKHIAKRKAQKRKAMDNFRNNLKKLPKDKRKDEYWKLSKKSYEHSKRTGKPSKYINQKLKIIKTTY
ncbi:MAG: hypothetical protein ACPGXZ_00810 [Saprospiraceae bacterium]